MNPAAPAATASPAAFDGEQIARLKAEITAQLTGEFKAMLSQQIVREIIGTLSEKFLGETPAAVTVAPAPAPATAVMQKPEAAKPAGPSAAQRIAAITSVPIKLDKAEVAVHTVALGASRNTGRHARQGPDHRRRDSDAVPPLGGDACRTVRSWRWRSSMS